MKSDSSKQIKLKFPLVYQNTINTKSTGFSPLSLFLTQYRLPPHPKFYVKKVISLMRAWRFFRVAEHPWQGSHFRNSVKDLLKKLCKLYLSLRRVPSLFWSWMRQLDWIETGIMMFSDHLLKPTVWSKKWRSHLEDAGLFKTEDLLTSLKKQWNNHSLNISLSL
jgi:hypothetical protein